MSATRLLFRNRLGRTLKMIRQAKGLSQSGLAEKMLTTRQTLSNLERGEKLPNVLTFERACKGLNVSPVTVLRLTEIEEKKAA